MPQGLLQKQCFVASSGKTDGLSDFAWKLMQAEERSAALRNQRVITILIATMVPAFSVLDYFAYPEFFEIFAVLRLVCTLCALFTYSAIRSKWGKRYYRIFTVAMPLIPAFFISLMVLLSQDPGTPYYAGLTLCIIAIGFVFHWTYQEAFFGATCVGTMYLLASAPAVLNGMDVKTAASFVNNCIFIAANGVVVVSGCFVHHRYRVQEFLMRDRSRQQRIKLRAQKRELIQTLEELNQTENQLIQSEKMASLGQLSAGVIHEIGNPLNYSNQAVFLLRKLLRSENPNGRVIEAIDDIQDSIDRMKEIVRELREFSHKTGENNIEHPLADPVQIALRMLGKEIESSETTVTIEVPEEIRIEGVKNQVTQVLINLIHNAIQAMSGAGWDRKNLIDIKASADGEKALITVRDNGPGIDPENLSRIFDPFYTTKEVGEGTGLGLSICYRIVESHNGQITVDSKPGEFTEFSISLPLAQATAGGTTPHHAKPTHTKYGQEVF
ncbi:MAG: GHKL domain-containing protein [Verrucomicrobiales bacterium]|nr:GHKL domain-containing protein [Verrucomicrobiales bacterium]